MKNSYQIEGDIVKVYFRKTDGFFIIDKDDLEKISHHTWHLNTTGYADCKLTNGPHLKLHHVIIGKPPKGMVTDHINRNRLDNRKANLRHVTPHENNMNKALSDHVINNKMMGIRTYIGKRTKTYYVALHGKDNRHIHIGKFKTLEEAMSARDKAYEQIWKQ